MSHASRISLTSPEANCFDLLRLLLAGLVIYSHSFHVGGFGNEGLSGLIRGQTIAGSIGVLGFFGLSGYLVAASFLRDPNAYRFLRRRALRIIPGFWGCLLVTAMILAPLIHWSRNGSLVGFAWIGEDSALSYFVHNASLRIHQWSIGSTLASAPAPASLNGSLWSLFPEAACYGLLLLAGLLGLLTSNRLYLLLLSILVAIYHALRVSRVPLAPNTLPTLVSLTPLTPYVLAFLVGATCRAYAAELAFNRRGAAAFAVVLAVLLHLGGFNLASPVIVPLFLLHAGHAFNVRLRHDFSYGAYVYAFPCQQALVLVPGLRDSPGLFQLASFTATAALAAFSWFAIERHFLSRSRSSNSTAGRVPGSSL